MRIIYLLESINNRSEWAISMDDHKVLLTQRPRKEVAGHVFTLVTEEMGK